MAESSCPAARGDELEGRHWHIHRSRCHPQGCLLGPVTRPLPHREPGPCGDPSPRLSRPLPLPSLLCHISLSSSAPTPTAGPPCASLTPHIPNLLSPFPAIAHLLGLPSSPESFLPPVSCSFMPLLPHSSPVLPVHSVPTLWATVVSTWHPQSKHQAPHWLSSPWRC